MSEYEPTTRTTPTRSADRVSYDRAAVHAVLDEALVCHVGFVVDGEPVVLPQLHVRVGETLYLHGSTGARALRSAAADDGLPVCVTVTLTDGLVLARSAFHHSVNYRSVVVRGRAHLVQDGDERADVLRRLVDAVVPGRSDHVRGPDRKELAATAVLAVPLREVSLKARSGPPSDEPRDVAGGWWAGVVPLAVTAGPPEPAPDLARGTEVPPHVAAMARP